MLRSRLAAFLAALTLAGTAGALSAAAPASAALPDAYGFVLYNGAAPVATGTWPAATTVVAGPAGLYQIKFPGLAARGGVVHVTAIHGTGRYCQAVKWGPSGADEIVIVRCALPGGAPAAGAAFSALFTSSSGRAPAINGRYGYVDANPNNTLNDQYNSSGAVNSVSGGGGVWEVKLPGLSTAGPLDGSIQVTAVDSVAARCKVLKWASDPGGQIVVVGCFDAAGAPFKTRFTLTYQYQQSLWGAGWPPRAFGYIWNKPFGGPVSTNFNSQLGSGANTLTPAGVGLTLVQFPRIGVAPDTVQVTAFGPGNGYCNLLTTWAHIGGDTVVRDVACYTAAGARVNGGFFNSANAAF